MGENVSVAQARLLLTSLYAHATEVSQKMAAIEHRLRHNATHGVTELRQRQHVASLQRDLHEAYRLISGLHRRFPATREAPSPSSRPLAAEDSISIPARAARVRWELIHPGGSPS